MKGNRFENRDWKEVIRNDSTGEGLIDIKS